MASNSFFSKYNFGLLETPDSSDFHSYCDATLLSTSISTDGIIVNEKKSSTSETKKSPSNATSSLLSSTLCATAEISENTTAKNDSKHVFHIPIAPAPKRVLTSCTPKNTAKFSRIDRSLTTSSIKSTPMTKATPKSQCGDTPLHHSELSVVVAIVEGRGIARGEVGMASIDLKHPILNLSQFPDSQTYVKTLTKLNVLQPKEFVFPSTMCDSGNMAKVFKTVTENFPNSSITTVQRKYFNEASGLEEIKRLAMKEHSTIENDVNSKYYCLAAASALIRYVEVIQNSLYAPQSLSIVYRGSEQTTLIDSKTASILELLVNLEDSKSTFTLFGILNNTKTHGGAKLLRSNILQPPNDLPTIQARLNCVDELSDSSDLFFGIGRNSDHYAPEFSIRYVTKHCDLFKIVFSLQSALARFEIDVDRLLASLVQIPKHDTEKTREARTNTCILIKHVTELVPVLVDSLSDIHCDLLNAYKASLQDARFGHIRDTLEKVIHKDARYQKGHLNMRTQRCFAVKQGINGVLDLARQTYTEYIDDINELIQQLGEKHGLSLKCSYNASRGFHIQFSNKDAEKIPESFIKVTKTKTTCSCTTNDLVQLNDRLEQSVKDINCIADSIVQDLLKQVRSDIGCLYNLSEIISTLDMLMSFAHTRTTTDCVRPEFTDTLAIRQGKHPVLAKFCSTAIANNVYASEGSNFNIITGPNMGGKSTYLKMVPLLQILAQMGCYVPAEFASFRISDHIFSRVGGDDDIDSNSSSFTMEMKEISYIIQNADDNSLVIVDELGRGTSAEEGVGLCWAISEYLLSQKAFTFFATHYLELCRLQSVYPNVENYHFEIQHVMTRQGGFRKVIYTYVLSRGFTEQSHYGLQLAEFFNFPDSILKEAKEIADRMNEVKKASDAVITSKQKKENAIYKFATKLLQVARSSRLDDDALMDYFRRLKKDYLTEKQNIEAETTTSFTSEAALLPKGFSSSDTVHES